MISSGAMRKIILGAISGEGKAQWLRNGGCLRPATGSGWDGWQCRGLGIKSADAMKHDCQEAYDRIVIVPQKVEQLVLPLVSCSEAEKTCFTLRLQFS